LQLDDDSALMFYALRTREGRDALSAGTWIAADGRTRPLRNEDVQIDVLDHWSSPRGGRYPARWRLRVPSLALDLDVRPVLADQELDTDPRYWEGAVDVRGAREGREIGGRGYVELVGYAR
jgi:predicted secreted hydrolase